MSSAGLENSGLVHYSSLAEQLKQRGLNIIGVVERYTNLHAHADRGHRSRLCLYATWMRIFVFALYTVSDFISDIRSNWQGFKSGFAWLSLSSMPHETLHFKMNTFVFYKHAYVGMIGAHHSSVNVTI